MGAEQVVPVNRRYTSTLIAYVFQMSVDHKKWCIYPVNENEQAYAPFVRDPIFESRVLGVISQARQSRWYVSL